MRWRWTAALSCSALAVQPGFPALINGMHQSPGGLRSRMKCERIDEEAAGSVRSAARRRRPDETRGRVSGRACRWRSGPRMRYLTSLDKGGRCAWLKKTASKQVSSPIVAASLGADCLIGEGLGQLT